MEISLGLGKPRPRFPECPRRSFWETGQRPHPRTTRQEMGFAPQRPTFDRAFDPSRCPFERLPTSVTTILVGWPIRRRSSPIRRPQTRRTERFATSSVCASESPSHLATDSRHCHWQTGLRGTLRNLPPTARKRKTYRSTTRWCRRSYPRTLVRRHPLVEPKCRRSISNHQCPDG